MPAADIRIRLSLEGPLVLTRATALQTQLLEALDGASNVCLDVSQATEFDISFLQILIAAHKMAKTEGKELMVAQSDSGALAAQITRCGLPASVFLAFRDISSTDNENRT